jgi:hypothetical protein
MTSLFYFQYAERSVSQKDDCVVIGGIEWVAVNSSRLYCFLIIMFINRNSFQIFHLLAFHANGSMKKAANRSSMHPM